MTKLSLSSVGGFVLHRCTKNQSQFFYKVRTNTDHKILFNEVLAKTEKYLPRIIKESVEIQKYKIAAREMIRIN